MSFALIGLRANGVKIKHPECVSKTFPDYFQRLDALRKWMNYWKPQIAQISQIKISKGRLVWASRLGQMKTAIFIFLGGANPEVVNLLVAAKSLKC